MDANDVEMTMKRDRRDTDEVYPGDELQEDFAAYQPSARRQNRWFAASTVCFVLSIGVVFGAKVYMVPGENVELETDGMEQGTVSNNAANSKVSEALRDHKQMPAKKPHSSSWSQETADKDVVAKDQPDGETEGLDQNESETDTDGGNPKPDEGDNLSEKNKLKAWHKKKVSLSDGQMYKVLDVLSHDPNSFTEGLTYYNDKLYESVGLQGKSSLLVLDPNTGETLETHTMASKLFGEGLTYCHGKLYQLTYKAKTGFTYDIEQLDKPPEQWDYLTTTGEGWGFTYDEKRDEFIVSDGSAFLHFWDRKTLKQVRKHQIMRLDGSKANRMNELEFWRDRVVANVWYKDILLIINPVTGLVEKEYDFSTIWNVAGETRNRKAEVFNGISISSDPDVLYVTGKWWAKMFKVKLLPEIPS